MKTYYAGNETGEVVCAECAGVALKASIANARVGQMQNFQGAQEPFYKMYLADVAVLAEMGEPICYCDVK